MAVSCGLLGCPSHGFRYIAIFLVFESMKLAARAKGMKIQEWPITVNWSPSNENVKAVQAAQSASGALYIHCDQDKRLKHSFSATKLLSQI